MSALPGRSDDGRRVARSVTRGRRLLGERKLAAEHGLEALGLVRSGEEEALGGVAPELA